LLDQAQTEADLARLERLERAHARNLVQLRDSIRDNQRGIDHHTDLVDATAAAIARRRDTRGDAFAMAVHGQTTSKRPEAEARLRAALAGLMHDRGIRDGTATPVGSLGGFAVSATVTRAIADDPALILALDDVPESGVRLTAGRLADAALVARLEHRLNGLERLREESAMRLERLRAEVAKAHDLLGKPFPHAEQLAIARARVNEVSEKLKALANESADGVAVRPEVEAAANRTSTPQLHQSHDSQTSVAVARVIVEEERDAWSERVDREPDAGPQVVV
jgi:hypothetical protein